MLTGTARSRASNFTAKRVKVEKISHLRYVTTEFSNITVSKIQPLSHWCTTKTNSPKRDVIEYIENRQLWDFMTTGNLRNAEENGNNLSRMSAMTHANISRPSGNCSATVNMKNKHCQLLQTPSNNTNTILSTKVNILLLNVDMIFVTQWGASIYLCLKAKLFLTLSEVKYNL